MTGASRVAVVGGGISGLAAAHRLHELGVRFTLLERASRCGGVIWTEHAGGFLVEAGPDSFLARKPWATDLCRRLSLADEIVPTDPTRRGSFILWEGRLHPLPEGLTSLVPTRLGPLARSSLLSAAAKARLLVEPLLPRAPEAEDESLASFFRRRLGDEASRRLVEPLVRGIYGGNPETLSLHATFPQLAGIERRHGSLIRGLLRESRVAPRRGAEEAPAFLSLREGMGSLVDRLVAVLPRDAVRTGVAVRALRRDRAGRFELALEASRSGAGGGAGAEVLVADGVILATPAAEAARLTADLDSPLGELLGGITAGSSLSIALGFPRRWVAHPLDGYWFVVPEGEAEPLLACTWASSKFPGRAPRGFILLRAFLDRADDFADADDGVVIEAALAVLRGILGLGGRPVLARVHRWRDALPRYAVGHPRRMVGIEARLAAWPGLFLAGAAYRGVGVPDCVREGEAAAAAAGTFLTGRANYPAPAN